MFFSTVCQNKTILILNLYLRMDRIDCMASCNCMLSVLHSITGNGRFLVSLHRFYLEGLLSNLMPQHIQFEGESLKP